MSIDAPSSDPREMPPCHCAGAPLELVRVSPRVGGLPELRTYRCSRCGFVQTLEMATLSDASQPQRASSK